MDVPYALIKSQALTKNLLPQILKLNNLYYIKVYDGPFLLECTIDVSSDDATDLTTYLLPLANKPLGTTAQLPFASKQIGTKKLYKRATGKQFSLQNGINILTFTIPYAWVKITGLEIINGESLDTVNLYILDDTHGTYSGTPNATLNQFAYTLNITKDFHSYASEFDADIYGGMQVKLEYYSMSTKTVGVNFILNEVK